MPSLSLVVCTKDRAEQLVGMCKGLLSQSRLPDELVFVDQSTSDSGKREVESIAVRRLIKTQYIHDARIRGLAHARNVGLECTTGDFIVFIDDDIELAPDSLALLERALNGFESLLAVSGIVTNYQPPTLLVQVFTKLFFVGPVVDERQPIYGRWQHFASGELMPTTKLCGGCMMWRREAITSIGGFDPQYKGSSVGEDIEISQRMLHAQPSGHFAFVGGAWVVNHVKGSWRSRDYLEETQLACAHYLYFRNGLKTPGKRLAYILLTMGLWLSACTSALRRLRWQPIASLLNGIRCVRSGYRGCAFLEPMTYRPMTIDPSKIDKDGVDAVAASLSDSADKG